MRMPSHHSTYHSMSAIGVGADSHPLPTTLPERKRTTLCAIGASAELWVILSNRHSSQSRQMSWQLQGLLAGLIVERAGRLVVHNSSFGFLAIARAMDTRCCSPPDGCAGKLLSWSPRPNLVQGAGTGSKWSGQIRDASSTFSNAVDSARDCRTEDELMSIRR